MEEGDLGLSWRHLEAVGVLPGCHPPGQHGGRDPESSVRDVVAFSHNDWLSPEKLGLVIESPENIRDLSLPQLNPQVPQACRIEVHCDDPGGQRAQRPCMDWALEDRLQESRHQCTITQRGCGGSCLQ